MIVGFIALVPIGTWLLDVRTRRIARQRRGEGFSEFAAHFAGEVIPPEILKNAYNYFEDWNAGAVENFPVRATDSIAEVYGIVDEDFADALEEILKASGRRAFTRLEQPQLPVFETVADVVLYAASAPLAWP